MFCLARKIFDNYVLKIFFLKLKNRKKGCLKKLYKYWKCKVLYQKAHGRFRKNIYNPMYLVCFVAKSVGGINIPMTKYA